MKSHISFDVEDMIVQALRNVLNADTSDSVFVMCKMDGTYDDSRIRWNPNDDHLYGFCWEHSYTKRLVFDNIENIESLAQDVINKEIHIPKEMFVLGLGTTMGLLVPAIATPVCTHSNIKQQNDSLEAVMKVCKEGGKILINFATDGDSTRRQIFSSLMNLNLDDFDFGNHLEGMFLFDKHVGPAGVSVNYDPKHLAKRIRNTLISERKEIGSRLDVSEHVREISTIALLKPEDRQNVPYATELLLRLINFSEKDDLVLSLGLTQVAPALKLFSYICKGVLVQFAILSLSMQEILVSISIASHILFCMYRKFGSPFRPGQLYHDLMETFRDVFISAAKYKEMNPDEPFKLTELGTDLLEKYLNLIRSTHNSGMLDCLEIVNRSKWLHAVDKVLTDHPDWNTKHYGPKRLTVTLDKSI